VLPFSVHPSLRPSASDSRNTSNDRRILNAALHWNQSLAETGCVVLVTDDRNLAALAQAEDMPSVGLYALDRALCAPGMAGRDVDSVLLREAMSSCSRELSVSLASSAAKPAPRLDKNVYEALGDALALLEQAYAHPDRRLQRSDEEIEQMLEQWRGVLANAPQLITSLRNRNNNTQSAAASTPSAPLPPMR